MGTETILEQLSRTLPMFVDGMVITTAVIAIVVIVLVMAEAIPTGQ